MKLAVLTVALLISYTASFADTPAPSSPTTTAPSDPPAVVEQGPALRYKLSDGADRWDPAVRARIVAAMDEAVAIYNALGTFDKLVTANFNEKTPTADANYDGWINFGGQINARVALHEIGHTLGVGTHPDWRSFLDSGKHWTGSYALSQLRAFDGPDAVLKGDRQHFWPYGLNYDKEDGPEQRRRHVLLIAALRRDLGIANDSATDAK